MSNQVTILPVKHARYSFKVSFRETNSAGAVGRRFRYFETKSEADSFAREKSVELQNHGTRHATVEDNERAGLIRYREWAATRPDAPTIATLIERAIAAHESERPAYSVAQAIADRLDAVAKRKLSPRHLADLRARLGRFEADFGPQQISTVKPAAIEAWLHRLGVGGETWRNYAKAIGSVFTLAVKRGYLLASPFAGIDRPKVTRQAPSILAPRQLAAVLTASAPELRPLLVLQAFCGLRRAEAGRLAWSHIHFEASPPYVELPSSVTKTNRRRTCELPPCAAAWLQPLAGLPSASLGLTETIYRNRLQDAAADAGVTWENNVLRHSFGTYRLAVTKNAAQVAEEMGNSPAIVRTHYANVTSPEQAAEYWRILPEAGHASVLPFDAGQKAG